MSEQADPPTGKVTSTVFSDVILGHLGARDADVLVGPRHGVDVGVLRVAPGIAMALTTDPVFVVPGYGWDRAAWFAVHTARYDGCNWPMVGGATCAAIGPENAFVTPTMAQPGDRVVVTKGAAIEATALFAATFPDRLAKGVGEAVTAAADRLFEHMTVVPEARIAAGYGLRDRGVTAMHDATEGGVLGALAELAAASRVGLRIELDAIPVRPEVRLVCDYVGIDPYISISA